MCVSVMHLKKEKFNLERDRGGGAPSVAALQMPVTTKGKLLKHATERHKVRIKAMGACCCRREGGRKAEA